MKQWEDSIKKKLEGYESALPEGGLAEFRAALSGKKAARRHPAGNAVPWLLGFAMAACLAAFLLIRHGDGTPGEIRVIEQSPVAGITSSDDVADSLDMTENRLLAQANGHRVPPAAKSSSISDLSIEENDNKENVNHPESETEQKDGPDEVPDTTDMPSTRPSSSFLPGRTSTKKVDIQVGAAAAGVLGLGAIGGVAAMLPGLTSSMDMAPIQGDPGGVITDPAKPENKWTGECDHSMPLRLGMSARIPLGDRLHLTTRMFRAIRSTPMT